MHVQLRQKHVAWDNLTLNTLAQCVYPRKFLHWIDSKKLKNLGTHHGQTLNEQISQITKLWWRKSKTNLNTKSANLIVMRMHNEETI